MYYTVAPQPIGYNGTRLTDVSQNAHNLSIKQILY